jgi:hypothetical protein
VVGVRQDSAAANPLGFTVMTASGAHFQKTRTIPVISFHTMACREENISEIAKTGLGPEEENEDIRYCCVEMGRRAPDNRRKESQPGEPRPKATAYCT